MSKNNNDVLTFDLLIVGAGPAGLATAIRVKQLNPEISVCVLEKAAQPGAHTLSGAIIDPKSLNELLPNWLVDHAENFISVSNESFYLLTAKKSLSLPQWILPSCFANHGCVVGSLGKLVAWLASQAESHGVEIFCGFSASEILLKKQEVIGVRTGDMGVLKDGTHGENYQPGVAIHAKYTVFAEGCRGHLAKQIEAIFALRKNAQPQTYALGLKELWHIPKEQHSAGKVIHTAGWPLNNATYGGGFLYHYANGTVGLGFVVGLNYSNPHLSPYHEFQQWKHHPSIQPLIKGGECISYGARTIVAGGLQSLPKLTFPGGMLVGCDAGFLHAARLKGTHTAVKSGMLAAETIVDLIEQDTASIDPIAYQEKVQKSWIFSELKSTRNFKPWLSKGLIQGGAMFALEQKVLFGKSPWSLRNTTDYSKLIPAHRAPQIDYPKPDGQYSFDRMSSVYLSSTNHEENQPVHLVLKEPEKAISLNWEEYKSPEQLYCPAGVYEIEIGDNGQVNLKINAQNCLHCKACDIKDPGQNIIWKPPQGGEGPLWTEM